MKGLIAKMAPDAADFAPGLLAIQDSPPARLPRLVFYLVAGLFGILLAWSIFSKVDIVASSEGKLVPKTFTKIVQPSDSGIVREILVVAGQSVDAGQVLLRMDATAATADLATLRNESVLKGLTLRRIDAELKGQPLLMQTGDPSVLFNQVLAQYRARRQAYLDAISQEQATRDKARFDLQASEQMASKLRSTVPLYQQAATSYANLLRDNYVSALEANDKLREKIEKEQELKAQESTVNALKSAINQSDKKLAQIQSNYDSQLRNEQVDIESQSRKADGELTKQQFKSGLLELRAPEAGVVKDLSVTAGTVVQPGAVLLNIVPLAVPLVAEVAIKNEDVGFVQPGQSAKVKLMAYPFQKYGLVEGTVEHVAADASIADQRQQAQPAQTYKAFIKLKEQTLFAPNRDQLKLSPGMSVVVEIHQGQRSVMEYLLSPVQKVGQEAGRER